MRVDDRSKGSKEKAPGNLPGAKEAQLIACFRPHCA